MSPERTLRSPNDQSRTSSAQRRLRTAYGSIPLELNAARAFCACSPNSISSARLIIWVDPTTHIVHCVDLDSFNCTFPDPWVSCNSIVIRYRGYLFCEV